REGPHPRDARAGPQGAARPPDPGLRGARGARDPPGEPRSHQDVQAVHALRRVAARPAGRDPRRQDPRPARGPLRGVDRRHPPRRAARAAPPHDHELRGRGRGHPHRRDHRRDPAVHPRGLGLPSSAAAPHAASQRPTAPPSSRAQDRSALFDDRFLKTLEHLHMVSRKVFAGNLRAERRTRKVGSGIEFADHRTYARGDDFRYIDWNLYGRLDKLLLRLFEEEEDLHIYILIDVSDSMAIGAPLPKLHYAMQLGAALTYVGLANLDRVAIIPFSGKVIDRLPPARGKNRIFRVFEFLRTCEIGGQTDLAECMKTFVAQN